jgi:hypothetical protein
VCKELLVISVQKCLSESKGVVVSTKSIIFSLIRILKVVDFFACSMPPYTFILLYLIRKTKDFHPVVVQGVWLGKVEHVKFNFLPSLSVSNSEKVPLCMTVGVNVIL